MIKMKIIIFPILINQKKKIEISIKIKINFIANGILEKVIKKVFYRKLRGELVRLYGKKIRWYQVLKIYNVD